MANRNTGDSSRKPSGSSTHSGAHSPTNSPNNAQSQRKLTPGAAGTMFGVGMSNANGLKGLNSGWQVWGPTTPSSKRNTSVSSAASVTDLSSSQGEASYRGNLGEGWTTSRPTSGTWDEVSVSPQKKDYSQLESQALALHQARQRQAAAAQAAVFSVGRGDERSAGSKAGQFSPQRYEKSLTKESGPSSRYPTASPTKPAGYDTVSFPTPQTGPQGVNSGGGYDSLQASSFVDNNLSLALRGMAMDDDYIGSRQQIGPSQPSGMAGQISIPQMRPPPVMQQPRPYNTYSQTDYSAYYSNPPTREPYIDYQYGYDAYRGTSDSVYPTSGGMSSTTPANMYSGVSPQPLHPDAVADLHRQQSGMFYHYGGAARPPGSQFYYPAHQGIMYPPSHSSMLTSQLVASNHATLADKKRELQYNIQQQVAPQHLMYTPLRSTPSPHLQAYAAAMDYGSPLPIMLPGGMYGPGVNPRAMHVYQLGLRPDRRSDGNELIMSLRSPLLDEFRANKTRKWELKDVFGYIVEFSGDQHGSRFIQQKLEGATSEEKQKVFDEIVPDNTLQLIQDVFGNYVIQKLFEHGTQLQKIILANTMEGHILPLSLQMYGCRVVQKAVEYILPDQQSAFIKELDVHVLKCVKDANGNHVIQKLVERVSPDRLAFVNSFRGNVYDLSTHPYGCRVLQRCLEHLPAEQTRPLLDELHRYTINLMQDQFGNYVIQFVLEHGQPQDRALVIMKLRGQMLQMSRHKFASNVCEKALVTADPESRRVLIDEIMTPKQDGMSPILAMMKDQFANYVLQRALAVVEGEQKESLINKVRPQLVSMRRYSSAYSKHLISIERLLEQFVPVSEQADDLPNIPSELLN